MPRQACRPVEGGVEVKVRLTPKSSREGIDGLKQIGDEIYVQARVRSAPEDGKANKALVELFAAQLKLPKSSISLATGQASRLKTLHISGDPTTLGARIKAWLEKME